jgi:hypothetical protein
MRAIEECKAMNPRYMRPGNPRNQMGYTPFDMNHR